MTVMFTWFIEAKPTPGYGVRRILAREPWQCMGPMNTGQQILQGGLTGTTSLRIADSAEEAVCSAGRETWFFDTLF